MAYYTDYPVLQTKLREIVRHIIETSPAILVSHVILQKCWITKFQYGINQKEIVPADFPSFPVAYVHVGWCHGYIHLSVHELTQECVNEATRQRTTGSRARRSEDTDSPERLEQDAPKMEPDGEQRESRSSGKRKRRVEVAP